MAGAQGSLAWGSKDAQHNPASWNPAAAANLLAAHGGDSRTLYLPTLGPAPTPQNASREHTLHHEHAPSASQHSTAAAGSQVPPAPRCQHGFVSPHHPCRPRFRSKAPCPPPPRHAKAHQAPLVHCFRGHAAGAHPASSLQRPSPHTGRQQEANPAERCHSPCCPFGLQQPLPRPRAALRQVQTWRHPAGEGLLGAERAGTPQGSKYPTHPCHHCSSGVCPGGPGGASPCGRLPQGHHQQAGGMGGLPGLPM